MDLLRTWVKRGLGICVLTVLFSGITIAREGRYFTGRYETLDAVDNREAFGINLDGRLMPAQRIERLVARDCRHPGQWRG